MCAVGADQSALLEREIRDPDHNVPPTRERCSGAHTTTPDAAGAGVYSGVIKEARRRQRSRRLLGLTVFALAAGLIALAGALHPASRAGSASRPALAPSAGSAASMLAREPDLGVACATSSSFKCDRVGLAVWLRRPAYRIEATIAGMPIVLSDPAWSGPEIHGRRTMFAGFLQPAGMLKGTLKVHPDRGRYWWAGGHPTSARVRILADYGGGHKLSATVTLELRAGWG